MAARSFLPPEHWRDRAEEARAMADQLRDPSSRLALFQIAEGYEKLARRAEMRIATAPEADQASPIRARSRWV